MDDYYVCQFDHYFYDYEIEEYHYGPNDPPDYICPECGTTEMEKLEFCLIHEDYVRESEYEYATDSCKTCFALNTTEDLR